MQADIAPDIVRSIKVSKDRLGSAGRKIANMVIEHPEKVIHLSISEIASAVDVSEASVVRFCQEFGYKGFQDFKIHLSQTLVKPVKSLDVNIELDDSAKTLLEKVSNTTIQTIVDTVGVNNEKSLAQAIDLLANSKRIVFVGCGGSGIIANDAHHKFMKLGLNVISYSDAHNAAQACSVLTQKDLVFIISHSGTTRDILKVAKTAKENKCPIIAVTRVANTPLSRLASVVLPTSSPESQYRSEGVSSRVAQLCIIDALFVGVYVSSETRFTDPLQKTRRALSDFRL